jgi:Skp family chaperone for outer membrane proteins
VAEVELPNPEELEERRDKSFSRRVALTTAVYAVILAVASLGAGNAMKHMLLAQQQSSDQWAFYQAKVIREHLYRAQALVMQAELADAAAARGPRQEKLQALATKFSDEEKRYNAEKKDIEKDAKKLEHERDHYRTRDRYFEFAEVFLQIAIVCSSVAILATSRAMFVFSMVVAALGVLSTLNGFVHFLHVGFLEH